MPATKTPAKASPTPAKAREEMRRLDLITDTLELVQKDVGSIGSSFGTGARDIRRDVAKLLRDAQRDLHKLRHALERDLTRLQKDLSSAGKAS